MTGRIMRSNKYDVDIAEIRSDIKYMRERLDELHCKISGNGKPGLVDEMSQLKGGLRVTQFFFTGLISVLSLIFAIWK